MKKNYGFTLIELMIVVAIIAIIAAIAIPNLLRSRMQTNEASAISNLRAINGAETAFHSANSRYTNVWTDMTAPVSGPPFLDGDWTLVKSGYLFTLAGDNINAYTATANPSVMGTTGNRGFFTDESGVLRFEVGAVATIASNPLGTVVP